jgi:uncharacterized membrane protein
MTRASNRRPLIAAGLLLGVRMGGFVDGIVFHQILQLKPGERLYLHFGAVDYEAAVWANGGLVATHRGGSTPFADD